MTSRLQEIVDAHREVALADTRDLDGLLEEARACPAPRDFAAALRAPGLSVIAEVKRRSPSAGVLNEGLDPSVLAKEFEVGGAACISVLTDEQFFGGSVRDLQAVKESVDLPVLRKDFTVDARDIADARIMGADAVLLIVAALSDRELAVFQRLALELGLTALVEVHNAQEIERAHLAFARVIGVNQRDLATFEIDATCAGHLYPALGDAVTVAESAIASVQDAHRLHDIGYDAVLVGTALVTSDDPCQMLREMTRHEMEH